MINIGKAHKKNKKDDECKSDELKRLVPELYICYKIQFGLFKFYAQSAQSHSSLLKPCFTDA